MKTEELKKQSLPKRLSVLAISLVIATVSITPSAASASTQDTGWELFSFAPSVVISSTSVINNDDSGATVVLASSGFKANGVLALSDFTIGTTGTGLTASSVSVNGSATEATLVFTGSALTGSVFITAKESAYATPPSDSSNTLAIPVERRILPACPASAAITEPCLDSGTISRTGAVGFRLSYSNNSGFEGSSFSLQAEIETAPGVFGVPQQGDVATDLVMLYPTASAIGARLATATWAMSSHKDFGYSKSITNENGSEVVKLTTSYEYIDFVNKDGCGVGAMSFGDAPQDACESVGINSDYQTSADRSIDFFAATDFDWLVGETGADGGYLNYLGSSFMWGSTQDTPLRFQLVGPHHKSANANDLNSGSFQVYLPSALVSTLYGANFEPASNLSLTRIDAGVLTATLSGTANVNLSRPLGGDLLIDVPTHPFSAPVFTVSYTSNPTGVGYTGPVISSPQVKAMPGSDLVLTGSKLGTVSKASLGGVDVSFTASSDTQLKFSIPADLPAGIYDLAIESNYGRLTVQSAVVVLEALVVDSDPDTSTLAKPWTKKLTAATVKIYTKDLVGVGKVQFMLNGKEVAWVNATSAADPKLRSAGGASYLVRTVNLVPGRKNAIEIWVDGVRVSRTAYTY